MGNMDNWQKLCRVPTQYTSKIAFGNLKGKSDIKPQWRVKAMTEVYGGCGIGWKVEQVSDKIIDCSNGEVLLFITVALFVKNGDVWSDAILGHGGDKIVTKNKNGLIPNDEAYKMAFTDAMGAAMTRVGVASEIYEGGFDGSKYREYTDATPQPVESLTAKNLAQVEAIIAENSDKIENLYDLVIDTAKVKDLKEIANSRFDGLMNYIRKLVTMQAGNNE